MRLRLGVVLASVIVLHAHGLLAQELFDIPLRIVMGGSTTVDSYGRTWLGEGPGAGDPLNIRPNDAGGANWAENWSTGVLKPDSMLNLGYDPDHPGDSYIMNTIRWDDGATPTNFITEIPVPNGTYQVNMFFNEQCCPARHFKISIEGVVVDEDVSYADYNPGDPQLGWLGLLSFPGIVVADKTLSIELLPCPTCPGSTDNNAIWNALEVLSGTGCDNLGLNFNCAWDAATDRVSGTWAGTAAASYDLLKNGALLTTFPAGTVSFNDDTPRTGGVAPTYTLRAKDAGGATLTECSCTVKAYTSPADLICTNTPGTNEVNLTWTGGTAAAITGHEIRRNGELIATLPGDATSFEDTFTERYINYSVQALPADIFPALTCSACIESVLLPIPLRINMGGAETVDSHGNVWLGDGPGAGDPLCIRPDDGGGTNWIENWSIPVFQPASLAALGFDPTHEGDKYIFNTIRWDNAADGIDFRLSLPVANGEYFVNLYFNENGGVNRHFKIEVQGEVVDADVSYLDYDQASPASGKVGRLTFRAEVTTQELAIGLLPCPDCPGVTDQNAIINAVEVLPAVCGPSVQQCARNFSCTVDEAGEVTAVWDPAICLDVTSYEVRKNGALIQTLPGTATGFTDDLGTRTSVYQLSTVVPEGAPPCPTLICTAFSENLPFAVPVRLNMGGRTTVDSRGRFWFGDGPGVGDPLAIRPDDLSAVNTIENWCTQASVSQADSMLSLGFNPLNAQDQYIMNTIRWDNGADAIDYRLEIPIENGVHQVNFYFTECCCTNRHFKIEMQDFVFDDDVSYRDYDPMKPALGRTGRISFEEVEVVDGILKIGFLPCPTCPDPSPVDINAILDAIEILPVGTPLVSCPRSLVTSLADGVVTGTWAPGENVDVSGYDVYRDGVKIATLPGNATQFVDEGAPCQRLTNYEVEPLSTDPNFLCPGMRMRDRLVQPDCPYSTPLRINMGGAETVDSHGDTWLGDGPGAGDPLGIRPNDTGGNNFIENWSTGVFKPDSLAALGFDPNHAGDRYIFNTIRWDNAADGIDFLLEIPVDNGSYKINMYFNEAGGPNRHFKIELQGEVVDDDVSSNDYDPAQPGVPGIVGRFTFEGVVVDDGILRIGLLPCPACPGATDPNAIIDALEILSEVSGPPAPTGLVATAGNARVDLVWNAVTPAPDGYNVYRSTGGGALAKVNAELVTTTSYADLGLDNGTEYCYVVRAVAGAVESGDSNQSCATPQGGGNTFRRGDVDANKVLDLSDPIQVLGYLFLGTGTPVCLDAADTDDSGVIDITDAVANLGFQFLGEGPPPAPGPFNCGPDVNQEVPDLGCAAPCVP